MSAKASYSLNQHAGELFSISKNRERERKKTIITIGTVAPSPRRLLSARRARKDRRVFFAPRGCCSSLFSSSSFLRSMMMMMMMLTTVMVPRREKSSSHRPLLVSYSFFPLKRFANLREREREKTGGKTEEKNKLKDLPLPPGKTCGGTRCVYY